MPLRLLRALSGLLRPSLIGAAYLSAFVLLSLRRAASDSRVNGVEASSLTQAIATHFAEDVRRAGLLLLAVAALVGLGLGALAGLLVRARAGLSGQPAPGGGLLALRAAPVVLALHGGALLVGMTARPQLYEETFYAAGGAPRLLQILATDWLGMKGVAALLAIVGVAYLLLPTASLRETGARLFALRRSPSAIAAAAALGLLAAAAWGAPSLRRPAAARQDASTRPNVLVLAADSLRPDHILPTIAPHLSALARRGATFERAYASLPRTFPSWVTMLTGRYPHHHGIRNMFPSRAARARDFDALPARLSAAGYRTTVVSDYAGDIFPRINLGFGSTLTPTFHFGEVIRQKAIEGQIALLPFLDTRPGRALVPSMLGLNRAPDAAGVARRSLEAIDGADGRPFFLVAFFSTTHFPYASPAPAYGRFTDASYRGRFKYQKVNLLGREAPPDPEDIRQIRALYDGAVSAVDEAAGDLLAGLSARGLDASTVIIVTADHGETLFEGGRGHGHGDHLFGEEALRVPLVVVDGRGPAPRQIPGIARDVDLAPTIYELTGVAPPGDLDGASLVPALRGEKLETAQAFAETGLWFTEEVPGVPQELRLPYPDISRMGEVVRGAGDDVVLQDAFFPLTTMAKHRAVFTTTRKLILAPTRQGVRSLLFDTEHDAACTREMSAEEPETTARMRATLLDWVLEDPRMELRGPHLVPRVGPLRGDGGGDTVRLGAP